MSSASIDLARLRGWVGQREVREQLVTPFPARALADLLDRDPAPAEGDALPPCWQWLYFLDTPRRAAIGVDGHPARGGFLPPVALPRRMWAAGELTVTAPLRIGVTATRTSTVHSVDLKQGKAGPLVFVVVEHVFAQGGRDCLHERQHIVYRDAPEGPTPLPPGEPVPAACPWSASTVPDAATLFRYSALTYNGHRIHYDRDYAVHDEHYPGLVVHGPLIATWLLELLARERPAARLRSFEFRALRPAFDGAPLRLCGEPVAGGARLWSADAANFVGLRAAAQFD